MFGEINQGGRPDGFPAGIILVLAYKREDYVKYFWYMALKNLHCLLENPNCRL
jgi:hypothetical protein